MLTKALWIGQWGVDYDAPAADNVAIAGTALFVFSRLGIIPVGGRQGWPGLQFSARRVLVSAEQDVRPALADVASTRVGRRE